jgi:hypothetical protein
MPSLLEFSNSSLFRKKLLTRNLSPYAKSPNKPSLPIDTVYRQTDSSVLDSPDSLIDEPSFANKLYPLNQYGSEGGYRQVPDPSALLNTKSNEGEYGQQDANILDQSVIQQKKWKPLNAYSNGAQLQLDAAEFITSLEKPAAYLNLQNNQPYPSTFVPSSYLPSSILLFRDPTGTNGLLSQDSYLQRLGAETLRKEFEQRIATQIRKNTIGRANLFNASSGTDILNIVTGIVPVIEPNYTITVPINPLLAASNFALRLAGSVLPVSPIPGSYWDPNINPGNPTTLQQVQNAFRRSGVGRFINNLLGGTQTGSQIMFNNLGAGQKSRLFTNIDYNKYKPNLIRNIFDRVAGALTGTQTDNSNYYIGSITSEPSRVFSPSESLPNDSFGREIQSPVYGPSELAQLYEGPNRQIRLGANGPTYSNGGGIEGGFTWVSPKYRGNAGKKVGIGGLITNEDEDFKPSSYNSTESTNIPFKEGSILDETQRLINSQPQGGKRLQHVGNAIDQVSKVFNDGYKELTKGSRVYRYVGAIGQEVGTEYCRVFAKDLPYLQYNDLQKVDGITTNGRRFSDSVLDNTYNLNIVPNKQEGGKSSTNLIGTPNNAYAKKYMFSLENLAWRTSSTPGYSVSDLPICERGPNGGRVMWFPPYGLTFSEQIQTGWQGTEFLGRPEPIYTYKSTNRGGSLQWKIVVDHPSVLNLIVNKVLGNETNKTRIDSIIESFFAGCRKYDLYELAKKYYTINPNDLFQLQQAITSKELSKEQLEFAKQTIQTGFQTPNGESTPISESGGIQKDFNGYIQTGFYFANDYPKKGNVTGYESQYNIYINQKNDYSKQKPSTYPQTSQFFDNVLDSNYGVLQQLVLDLQKEFETNTKGTITIIIDTSCSAPATIQYNNELSERRYESALLFFSENPILKKYYDPEGKGRLIIREGVRAGELTSSTPSSFKKNGDKYDLTPNQYGVYNCSKDNPDAVGGDTVGEKDVYTVAAMACRRSVISNIYNNTSSDKVPVSPPQPKYTEVVVGNKVTNSVRTQELSREWKPRDNITKRVLRSLLTECDYFEVIKQETPMVFDNLKDKLKFFDPTFHSITPEGLNSRLTFLQQCMRPGDTIPVVKQFGEEQFLQYNNAVNTSFGAPPVLVLRLGDFYHTKIIPDSLSITYEGLDFNPEGIGVQPMIANVTLQFKFVGGSGLKESIDKLQNALTFNYYANTEIYDDRADVTAQEDFLKVLDTEFLNAALNPQPPAINQAEPNNGQNNNNTIGRIISSNIESSGETGTISYSEFMENFVLQTQTYFQNVVNKSKEVTYQYNNAVRQQWMSERNYTNGILNVDTTIPYTLFGKPKNLEKKFNLVFKELISDIESNTEMFIEFISNDKLKLSTRLIKTIKNNYINYLKTKRGNFQNSITKITQDFVNLQQNYLLELQKVNIITFENIFSGGTVGTDGLQQPNGFVRVYLTSGTTEIHSTSQGVSDTLDELIEDIKKVVNNMNEFVTIIESENKFNNDKNQGILVFEVNDFGSSNIQTFDVKNVFTPFSKNEKFTFFSFRRTYMIVSDDVTDSKKYETFKNALIGNVINNSEIDKGGRDDISRIFDQYWLEKTKPIFEEENNLTKLFIDELEKGKLKNFINYTPFPKKKRMFTYTSDPISDQVIEKSQVNMIQNINAKTNKNTNTSNWNDLNGNAAGAYISKVKLN